MKEFDDFNRVSPPLKANAPGDRRERNPLITKEGFRLFKKLKEHPHAPKWNFETGDRLTEEDLHEKESFSAALETGRPGYSPDPPETVLDWVLEKRINTSVFKEQLPEGVVAASDDSKQSRAALKWTEIEPQSREDIATRVETFIPEDADLERLIVYDTSGTTGHAIVVPHHPAAMAKNLALLEFVLAKYGCLPDFSPKMTACLNIGAQANTVIFPSVICAWKEAGFAKINFHQDYWRKKSDASAFIKDVAPAFITGDPTGFAQMLKWGIDGDFGVLFSTAVSMPGDLAGRLKNKYSCDVVDWYSTTETGPIGYECRKKNGFHILPHDIYVEVIDKNNNPVEPGTKGEITVTGGRNPYLPMLRYRTGDFASIDNTPCPCGDHTPRLVGLSGRKPVLYIDGDGNPVNPVDIGRVLRTIPFLQHMMFQRTDKSFDIWIRPVTKDSRLNEDKIQEKLMLILGKKSIVRVHIDHELDVNMQTESFYDSEFGLFGD